MPILCSVSSVIIKLREIIFIFKIKLKVAIFMNVFKVEVVYFGPHTFTIVNIKFVCLFVFIYSLSLKLIVYKYTVYAFIILSNTTWAHALSILVDAVPSQTGKIKVTIMLLVGIKFKSTIISKWSPKVGHMEWTFITEARLLT